MEQIKKISKVITILSAILVTFLAVTNENLTKIIGGATSALLLLAMLPLYWCLSKYLRTVNEKEKKTEEFTGNGFMGGMSMDEEPSTEEKYKDYILQLISVVMNANGRQMVCELDRVKSTISRYYKSTSEQNEALQRFKTYLDSTIDIDKVCDEINRILTGPSREAIIMELLSVAYADGDFEKSEEDVIHKICERMDIMEQYISIVTIFRRKKKEGFYGDSTINSDRWKNEEDRTHEEKKEEERKKKAEEEGRGYWYRDHYGRKRWHENKTNDSYSNSNSNSGSNSGSGSNSYSSSASSFALNEAYSTLGITSSATDDEVRSAKKKMLRKWHPDLFMSQGDEAVRNATENSKIINQAYDIIARSRGMN